MREALTILTKLRMWYSFKKKEGGISYRQPVSESGRDYAATLYRTEVCREAHPSTTRMQSLPYSQVRE